MSRTASSDRGAPRPSNAATRYVLALVATVAIGAAACQSKDTEPDPAPAAAEAPETAAPEAVETVTLPREGKVFNPAIARAEVPEDAWYCDMGTVHFARPQKEDGLCPVCDMALVHKDAEIAAYDNAGVASAPVELMQPKVQSDKIRWTREAANPADFEDRCPAERTGYYKELSWNSDYGPDTPTADFVRQILERPHIRPEPWPLLYNMRQMDYHKNRAAVQAEFEKQLAAAPKAEHLRYLDNYAWFLAYMGEFKKIVEFFPERAEPYARDRSLEYGSIQFAISNAHMRIGNYAEAVETGKIAVELVSDAPNDTRWQLMFSELNLYGADFFEKYSKDVYTTKNIPDWYPKAEWELPFEDVTLTVGKEIDRWGGTGAVNFVDFDDDGWDDIMLERKYFPPVIYRNNEGKSFEPVESENLRECSNILSPVADFDNDGTLDMFRTCCNFDGDGPLRLLRGTGDFQFEDLTAGSVFENDVQCGMPPTWVDWDLDGDVDLFAGNFCGPSRAYRNDGGGKFTDVTDEAGFTTLGNGAPFREDEWSRDSPEFGSIGTTAGYFFGSGYPDLFVQGWGWRQFYKNNGDGTFEEVREKTGLPAGSNMKNYLTFVFDYNNDGHEDILSGSYVVGAGEQYGISSRCLCSNLLRPSGFSKPEVEGAVTIFENQGDGTFKDIRHLTQFVPLGVMGYSHGDWNNDGFEDVVFGLGGPYLQQAESYLFYQNNGGDGTFTQMVPYTALSLWGKGHGLAFGDYDHDGHVDLMINNGGAMPADSWPSVLLHNTGSDNHWVTVALEADPSTGTNAAAVGARIWVRAGDLRRVKTRFGGPFGTSSFQTHFGLGQNTHIDEIVVEWPNKEHSKTVLTDIAVDQAIVIHQRDGSYSKLWETMDTGAAAVAASAE